MKQNRKNESKVISVSVRITPELFEQIEKKAIEYGLSNGNGSGKSSLTSLLIFMGYLSLVKAEEQIEEIGRFSTPEVLYRISKNIDIGGTKWCWGLKNFLIPAIESMSVEEVLIKGLENLKKEEKQDE